MSNSNFSFADCDIDNGKTIRIKYSIGNLEYLNIIDKVNIALILDDQGSKALIDTLDYQKLFYGLDRLVRSG